MIDVFVYGTLLRGERNHGVVAPYLKAVQPGMVRGRMYDVGTYPALVLGTDDHLVVGEWFTVTGAGLKAMDALEEYFGPGHPDNEYERVQVADVSNGRSGWVYVWEDNRQCPEIVSGNWREFSLK